MQKEYQMKEGDEEESAVSYTVQSNLKQLLLKKFTFSVNYMLSFLNRVHFHLECYYFREMITVKESLKHVVFQLLHLFLYAKPEKAFDIRILRGFVSFLVYFPISGGTPGPTAEIISINPSKLSHLALY